jgi:predicted DNA-binding transcriptional regulator AlpA
MRNQQQGEESRQADSCQHSKDVMKQTPRDQVSTHPERKSVSPEGAPQLHNTTRMNAIDPLLTAADVAVVLGVRPKRVYELALPAVRISERSLRWKRADILAFIERRTEGGR